MNQQLQNLLNTGPVITKEEYRRLVLKGAPEQRDDFYSACKTGAIDPVFQDELIDGKYICGKLGGEPFLTVQRVDPITNKCPPGTLPCSTSTSIENTICYPQS